jgi:hypothetical protein
VNASFKYRALFSAVTATLSSAAYADDSASSEYRVIVDYSMDVF